MIDELDSASPVLQTSLLVRNTGFVAFAFAHGAEMFEMHYGPDRMVRSPKVASLALGRAAIVIVKEFVDAHREEVAKSLREAGLARQEAGKLPLFGNYRRSGGYSGIDVVREAEREKTLPELGRALAFRVLVKMDTVLVSLYYDGTIISATDADRTTEDMGVSAVLDFMCDHGEAAHEIGLDVTALEDLWGVPR